MAGVNNDQEFIEGVNFQVGCNSQSYDKVDRNSGYKVYTAENYQLFPSGAKVDSEFIAKLTDCPNCQSRVNSAWINMPGLSLSRIEAEFAAYEEIK